jgi:Fe2+ transport system protein B
MQIANQSLPFNAPAPRKSVVLAGLESSGKSALFRQLTGDDAGEESNFRGTTVQVRRAGLPVLGGDLVDTPGIRAQDDSQTTRAALAQVSAADIVVLVARGTHAQAEVETLLGELASRLDGARVALVITFEDKAATEIERFAQHCRQLLGVPVALVNARAMSATQRAVLTQTIQQAALLRQISGQPSVPTSSIPVVQPAATLYEHRMLGPWAAALTMLLMFAVPVALAYLLSQWLQPIFDALLIGPITTAFAPLEATAPLMHFLLVGSYGLITLGWYSFLWAFPVVLFIGLSVAVADETGIKDRIAAALDPWLRKIGLNGRDLIPVLSGFGCNVVAVFQTRSCSACTRKACVSLIAFGSACSYQIGASLSLFGSAQAPHLFVPYLLMLFIAGAIHTRIWNRSLPDSAALPLSERAFLQAPTARGLWWRVRGVVSQFLKQAMPIFLLICAIATALQYFGVMDWIANTIAPTMAVFGLPGEAAPGVIFSIARKDGLLVLNQDQGAFIRSLSGGQVLVLVWLASTLTACMVTLWTIRRELGPRVALTVGGRQVLTSLASAFVLSWVVRVVSA